MGFYRKIQWTWNFVSFYRSSSRTKDEFENFIKILKENLEHNGNKIQFLIVILGNFNAKMQV